MNGIISHNPDYQDRASSPPAPGRAVEPEDDAYERGQAEDDMDEAREQDSDYPAEEGGIVFGVRR